MRKPNQLFPVIFSLSLSICSFAQQGHIRGHIKDWETNTPINGANINLASNNKGDNTDMFGAFSISNVIAGQYELVASHIGYRTEIIPVEVKDNIVSTVSVNMKKTIPDLSQVLVNSKKT